MYGINLEEEYYLYIPDKMTNMKVRQFLKNNGYRWSDETDLTKNLLDVEYYIHLHPESRKITRLSKNGYKGAFTRLRLQKIEKENNIYELLINNKLKGEL